MKKIDNSGTTVFVYNAGGQLIAEYTSGPPTGSGTSYLTSDHLGSTRVVTKQDGSVKARFDYVPFGEELGAGVGSRTTGMGYSVANTTRQKFTQKERDSESGLDYFLARYYSSAQGRFTGVDPALESAVPSLPQSWNRYSYVLGNPLRYLDPNGELWLATGDSNDPYRWVGECSEGQTCYVSVSAVVSGNVVIYGSENLYDITIVSSNEHGMINMTDVARYSLDPGNPNLFSVAPQQHPEEYLAPDKAVALYNVAREYRTEYPNDDPLVMTAGSAANGQPAVDAHGQPVHQSHQNGANIDMRYVGANGTGLVGNTAADTADVQRTQTIIHAFGAQSAGLDAALTGNPARFGLGAIPENLRLIHRNHMHFQRNYPRPPQPPRRR